MNILLIDTDDSFTFNLHHYISSLNVKVDVRNDKINSKEIIKKKYDKIVISPDQVTQINLAIVLKYWIHYTKNYF